ncbi:MAG: T9SS type A sorting domain-containing protein [Bacteroidetes bacterium]|nr:T9SS type A sorting domain-containing protein [Bacteroidota bacterium]
MKKLFIYTILSFLFISSNILFAQPGFLDPTFGNGGLAGSNIIAQCHASAVQNDGKIILAGEFSAFVIERYTIDGVLDESFGVDGRVTITFYHNSDAATGVVIDNENNIIVSGYRVKNSIKDIDMVLVKLKPNGSIDSSFGENGISSLSINKLNYTTGMIQQADGKFIISGQNMKNEYDSKSIFLARFNSNGSIDSSFGEDGYIVRKFDLATTSESIIMQEDGKILTGGTYNFLSSRPSYYVARYNSDGSEDKSFGDNGIATYTFGLGQGSDEWANALHAITIQPDGKIICGGMQGDFANWSYDMGLVRFNPNGTLDNTYGENGTVKINYPGYFSQIITLMMQPDGKLIAGAMAQDNVVGADPMLLMRFLDNGDFDPGFAVNGMQVTTNNGFSIACKSGNLEQDGKIVLAGYSNSRLLAARYNGDNVLAAHFKDLKAILENDVITISWQTLNENNTKSFTVERSGNGKDFLGITTLPAKHAAGNAYNYTDKNPLYGDNYYRIKENAANGANTYSQILKVTFADSQTISLYPNPAKNTVTLKGLNINAKATIKITDMQGREISKQNFSNTSSATISIKTLAQGSYFILVEQEGKLTKLRLVKE